MYISTWVIIITIIAVIYFYSRSRKAKSTVGENLSTEQMWASADFWMQGVLEESPLIEKYLQDERDMVNAMERDMIRLKERFKHDAKKQLQIAQDWMDYSKSVYKIKSSRELLDVDWEDTALDTYEENTKEAYVIIQEIAKRVENELGKESNSKITHDRLRNHAKAVNEVFETGQKEKTK
jgi:hypothetical protein